MRNITIILIGYRERNVSDDCDIRLKEKMSSIEFWNLESIGFLEFCFAFLFHTLLDLFSFVGGSSLF